MRDACEHMSIAEMVHILKYDECFVKKVVALLEEYPDATNEKLIELLQEDNISI